MRYEGHCVIHTAMILNDCASVLWGKGSVYFQPLTLFGEIIKSDADYSCSNALMPESLGLCSSKIHNLGPKIIN